MRSSLLSAVLCTGLLCASTGTGFAITHQQRARVHYVHHKRRMNTLKRVGISAAGGVAIGALAGGPVGAAIGGIAGAGAGVLYDTHQKNHGHN